MLQLLKTEALDIPVIAAGGIFTGSDAAGFLESGAAAVQVATRFTVTKECGLPDKVKQEYFKASEDDIEVNTLSPTGYPMRMLKDSPGIGDGIRPNCEAYGYLLDAKGNCAYIDAWNREVALHPDVKKVPVKDKTCLCTHMRNLDIWTCGHYTYRLKDTCAVCPAHQRSSNCSRLTEQATGKVSYRFEWNQQVCAGCPLRAQCVSAGQDHRTIVVGKFHSLLQARRHEMQTEAFKKQMHRRNGIEGTQSKLVRGYGLRQARYRGQAKVRLQSYLIGAACNIRRLAWQAAQVQSVATAALSVMAG